MTRSLYIYRIILTVDPLNKKALLHMSIKMMLAFRKKIRKYVATFKFFVFANCKKLIKIVKLVELHTRNKSKDKLYRAAFIV